MNKLGRSAHHCHKEEIKAITSLLLLLFCILFILINCSRNGINLHSIDIEEIDNGLRCVVLHPIENEPVVLKISNLTVVSRVSHRILTNGWISQKETIEFRKVTNGISTITYFWKNKTFTKTFFELETEAQTASFSHGKDILDILPSTPALNNSKTEAIKPEILPKPTITDQAVDTKGVLTYDKTLYDKKIAQLANKNIIELDSSEPVIGQNPIEFKSSSWPVKTPYPKAGALLPFNRIIAYYGNFYSKRMGVLGAYPEEEMLAKLKDEVKGWELADPSTPVIPAIHYIASVAQPQPGQDKKYTRRMPFAEIDKSLKLAEKIDGVLFLDLQIGHADLLPEIEVLVKYLSLPHVHLGLDPEFAMKEGDIPGTRIGTLDARDVNDAAERLAKIVRENNLPPKVLVVHRFTQAMLTRAEEIKPLSEVQIVIHMDGFGPPYLKKSTYRDVIYNEPVQFAGFKIFYINDTAKGSRLMRHEEILRLSPIPIYIQYH